MSITGTVTMIKSALSSMFLFYLSIFKVPKVVNKEMIKIQRQFLWGGRDDRKKTMWVKWDKICLGKCRGA